MKQERKASTSLFQPRLRLGYTRSAHLFCDPKERPSLGGTAGGIYCSHLCSSKERRVQIPGGKLISPF